MGIGHGPLAGASMLSVARPRISNRASLWIKNIYVAYYMQPEVSYITGTYIHTYIQAWAGPRIVRLQLNGLEQHYNS